MTEDAEARNIQTICELAPFGCIEVHELVYRNDYICGPIIDTHSKVAH